MMGKSLGTTDLCRESDRRTHTLTQGYTHKKTKRTDFAHNYADKFTHVEVKIQTHCSVQSVHSFKQHTYRLIKL